MSPILEKAVAMSKQNVKIIYVKYMPNDVVPDGGINFLDLLDSTGEGLGILEQ